MWDGLKKCVPTKRQGEEILADRTVIGRALVFELMAASGSTLVSIQASTVFFSCRSSGTVSMTRSQSPRMDICNCVRDQAIEPLSGLFRLQLAGFNCAFEGPLHILACFLGKLRVCLYQSYSTGRSLVRKWRTIPFPMTPPPTTPIRLYIYSPQIESGLQPIPWP